MKKNSASRFFGIAAAALAVLFCFVACDKKPIGGGGTILPPDDEDPHVIELYIVTPPVKTKYRAGEMFDSTGMTLAAKWSHLDDDGNHIIEDLSPDECEINPDGALDSKDKNIMFIYEGASVAYPIEMSDVEIDGVTFDASSLPKMLRPGTIDLVAGIKVAVNYGDGTSSAVADFDVYERIGGEETKISMPTAYSLDTNGAHIFVAKYDKWSSDDIAVTVLNGYDVHSTDIVYSEILEADRSAYIGKSFLENTADAVYEDRECTSPIIAKPESGKGYLKNGEEVNFTEKYYNVGDEQGIPCLRDLKKGHVLRYHIYSDSDTRAELVLNAASGYMLVDGPGNNWEPLEMGEVLINELFDINVIKSDPETGIPVIENGEEVLTPIEVDDNAILPGKKSETPDYALWANFSDVSLGEVGLQKGDNTIELRVISEYVNCAYTPCAANVSDLRVFELPDCAEHNLEKENARAATCADYGGEEYWRCIDCSRTYSDAEGRNRIHNAPFRTPKTTDHTPGEEATCAKPQTCTTCGKVITPATGDHEPGPAATCEHGQTCTKCGTEIAPPSDHTFDAPPVCGSEAECKECHKIVLMPHSSIKWDGNEARCGVCRETAGKRYTVQAEDDSAVTVKNNDGSPITRKYERETVTDNWSKPVSNGTFGSSAMAGLDGASGWKAGNTVLTVKFNVENAGRYRLKMRAQSNLSDGGNGTQDLSAIFDCKVNGNAYSISGIVQSATDTGMWHRTYNWSITTFATVDFVAGENSVSLEFKGERGPNIDYFAAEPVLDVIDEEVEIVVARGEAKYAMGATTKEGVLENVMIRIAVPADKHGEIGCDFRDICVTDEIISASGATFDTSSVGEKSMSLKVNVYGKDYEITYRYTVTEA